MIVQYFHIDDVSLHKINGVKNIQTTTFQQRSIRTIRMKNFQLTCKEILIKITEKQ